MTNQRGRGIGQRDWLADSQQRVRRWLPAPALSLRRPGVMTRPTLGNVMQRRATKTIEGIPLGPIAGRNEVPLVLRRPIKTSMAPEPMLTLLSPTSFDVDEAVEIAPEASDVAGDDSPPSTAALPPALPSQPSGDPAGGIVTRVFRRLFSSPPPPAPEDHDEPSGYGEPPASACEVAPPPAEQTPPVATPAAEPAASPAAERHTMLQRSAAAPPSAAQEAPRRAVEAPPASPLSLITRLLPRRHEAEEPGGALPPAASAPETEAAPEPVETPAAPPTVEDVAVPAAPASVKADVDETNGAPERSAAPPADVPLILRHAAPRLDPEAAPESARPLASAEPAPPESPRPAAAPAVAPVVSPSIAAETAQTAAPVVSRSVAPPPAEAVAPQPGPTGLLLRLRRLIRPDVTDTEDAAAAVSSVSSPAGAVETPATIVTAAPAVSRSVEAHHATVEALARPREALSALQPGAPLSVRARRQTSSAAMPGGGVAAFPGASTESAGLQLEPWAPVFRARSQPAQAIESPSVLPDQDGAPADPTAALSAASDGNVTLSAPSTALAAQAVSRAETPVEARRPGGDAPEDAAKAGAALDQLASQVYERLRRRLVIERERAGGLGSQWQ